MNNYIVKVWLIMSAVLFFISCSPDLPQDIIAKVGNKEISVKEFQDVLLYNAYSNLSSTSQDLKHRVLSALIAQKIIAQEARDNQLNFEYLEKVIQQYKDEAIIEEFWNKQIFSKIEISEEELKTAYFRSKEKRIVEFMHFNTLQEAQGFRARIDKKNSFKNIAKSFGYDENTLPVDTISFGSPMPSIEESVFMLEHNQVSQPVKQGRNYFVFHLKGIQRDLFTAEDDFNFNKPKLEKRIRKKKTIKYYERYKKNYFPPFAYDLDKEVFKDITFKLEKALFSKITPGNQDRKTEPNSMLDVSLIAASYRNKKIVSFAGGATWSVQQLLQKLSVSPYPIDLKSGSAFKTSMIVAVKHILDDQIIINHGNELGLQKSSYVSQETQAWKDHLTSTALLKEIDILSNNQLDSHTLESFLLKKAPQYSININHKLLETVESTTTDMVVLKEHFPGRTIVPSLSPYLDLNKWDDYLKNRNIQ